MFGVAPYCQIAVRPRKSEWSQASTEMLHIADTVAPEHGFRIYGAGAPGILERWSHVNLERCTDDV
jgi:hypothetical protein